MLLFVSLVAKGLPSRRSVELLQWLQVSCSAKCCVRKWHYIFWPSNWSNICSNGLAFAFSLCFEARLTFSSR